MKIDFGGYKLTFMPCEWQRVTITSYGLQIVGENGIPKDLVFLGKEKDPNLTKAQPLFKRPLSAGSKPPVGSQPFRKQKRKPKLLEVPNVGLNFNRKIEPPETRPDPLSPVPEPKKTERDKWAELCEEFKEASSDESFDPCSEEGPTSKNIYSYSIKYIQNKEERVAKQYDPVALFQSVNRIENRSLLLLEQQKALENHGKLIKELRSDLTNQSTLPTTNSILDDTVNSISSKKPTRRRKKKKDEIDPLKGDESKQL